MAETVVVGVRPIINYLIVTAYYFLWRLLHLVYRCQADLREKVETNLRWILRRLMSCLPAYSYHGELVTLAQSVEKLQKIPKHLAISVIECDGVSVGDSLDLQTLARVISWAWVARIPVVSLYDYHGRLKTSYRELGCYVQEELIQNFWAVRQYGRASDPPCVKFHNVPMINGYSNGIGSNGFKVSSNALHIAVYSHDDGKPEIMRTAKQIYFDHVKHEGHEDGRTESCSEDFLSISNLNEEKLDSILNKNNSWLRSLGSGATPEPDLLLILGSIQSTLGFLPWHIRLTEIQWLPKLPNVETRDFLEALRKYSRCQQRFGT